MIKKISTFLLLTILFSFTLGFEIPSPDGFVNDMTNTLTVDQKTQISDLISNIKQTTSTEIAVLIVPTIDGDDVNLLATEIGTQRGVGEESKDNGIIMLFAMEDRSRSIQIGYGLEGTIPDAIAKRIGENNIVPNFREGNYFQGIYAAINEINLYIQKDPTVIEAYKPDNLSTDRGKINIELIIFRLFIASVIGRSIIPKSKIKNKNKRIITVLVILGASIIVGLIISNIIMPIIAGYIGMLLGIFGKGGKGGLGGGIIGGGFSGGGGGGFGGFGGGSFGGGGGGGKR
ncbi:MAG: TPM domain-containing protein [Candidatus Absconditicoccaceae bacterium]